MLSKKILFPTKRRSWGWKKERRNVNKQMSVHWNTQLFYAMKKSGKKSKAKRKSSKYTENWSYSVDLLQTEDNILWC